jgi:hypothetical protein
VLPISAGRQGTPRHRGAGDYAAHRFLEFFAATIRNKNTRMAYYRALTEFFAWVERHKIGQLANIEPLQRPAPTFEP